MSASSKTAIVTGASQGIGAGIVKAFVERGFNVVSFGEDAPEERYDFETWEGSVAFSMALHISWDNLADRLLRKYAIDYVPSDVVLPDTKWEVLE